MSDFQERLEKGLEMIARVWLGYAKLVCMAAKHLYHVRVRAPMLIAQYENEIRKTEELLKYTKHSKKRRKHERRLKWLQAELASLYEVVGNNESTRT